MPSKTLSLCMITKNEENILDTSLSCIKDYVDEIIIVDTGSTDRTLEIASKYTDSIFDLKWTNDFSEARNFSLSKATSDIIVVLDADELVMEGSLLRDIKSSKGDAVYCSRVLECKFNQSVKRDYDYYWNNRLVENVTYKEIIFPNHKGFKYKGRIHEYIVNFHGNRISVDNKLPELNILHARNKERQKVKFEYYNKLIETELEEVENPGNYTNLILNLLHYYTKKDDYSQIMSILNDYSIEFIKLRENHFSFSRLLKSLFIKGYYLIISKIMGFNEHNNIPEIHYINSTNFININWIKYFKNFRGNSPSPSMLSINYNNSLTAKNLKKCLEASFDKGFVINEILINQIYLSEVCKPLFKELFLKYGVIFIINIEDLEQPMLFSYINELRGVIGEVFFRINVYKIDYNDLKSKIDILSVINKNFIININYEYDMEEKETLSIVDKFYSQIIDYGKKKSLFISLENFPLCEWLHDIEKRSYLFKYICYGSGTISGKQLDIKNSNCNCIIKEYCSFCNNSSNYIKEYNDISELIKFKLSFQENIGVKGAR